MITEDQFIEKVSELMDKAKEDAIERARSTLRSGAIDPRRYDNDYLLPKAFIVAYTARMRDQWRIPSSTARWKKEIKNMEYFI